MQWILVHWNALSYTIELILVHWNALNYTIQWILHGPLETIKLLTYTI